MHNRRLDFDVCAAVQRQTWQIMTKPEGGEHKCEFRLCVPCAVCCVRVCVRVLMLFIVVMKQVEQNGNACYCATVKGDCSESIPKLKYGVAIENGSEG